MQFLLCMTLLAMTESTGCTVPCGLQDYSRILHFISLFQHEAKPFSYTIRPLQVFLVVSISYHLYKCEAACKKVKPVSRFLKVTGSSVAYIL